VYIPKADGKVRPLGIAALEDKIVQHAVSEMLSSIYEADFYGFSYGFRPGRGCHDALDALYVAITRKKVNYVLDADIQGFFDSISHEWMLRFLERRVTDQRILRLIRRWLRAGVSEEGVTTGTTVGTPQGAVISPLLANVFLHYVLDDWVVWWRRTHAAGDVVIVRYADDFVMGFKRKQEAERFLKALAERLQMFGLSLHPEKTRLIEFGRFAVQDRHKRGEGKPETFDFLGFTHICATTWKDKSFKILRQTTRKRKRDVIKRISQTLRARMHDDIDEVGKWLQRVMQGYYQYFAVPDNTRTLSSIRNAIMLYWLKVLRRRSQKRQMSLEHFDKIARRWLPKPTPLHPYPDVRFCAKHS
jgi:group II intron reverse transcriptase/maturase